MKTYFVELTDIGRSHLNSEELNVNDLKDNEAIIKSEYSLISAGTELSRAFALKKGFSYPVRPGYSTVGRIIAKGKDIKAEVGDRVFASSPHASIPKETSISINNMYLRKLFSNGFWSAIGTSIIR